jgi:SAM-dependent methyltransferase
MPLDPIKGAENPYKDFVVCTECGLGAVSPMPRPEEIPSFYDTARYYTHGQGHLTEVDQTLVDRALLHAAWRLDKGRSLDPERIAEDLPPGASICDLGCGGGELLGRFKALGFNVLGVEPDAAARAEAAKAGVTVLAGTCEELPADLKGQSCDLVIMRHVLEHCRDPILALQKAFFLTRPGGILFCEVPNCAATHFKSLGVCSAMFDAPRHLYFFTPACLRKVIGLGGFTFSGFQYMGYTRHHHASWRQWEASIYDRTREYTPRPSGKRHTLLRSIQLLLSTAFASDEKKYDSVAVFGRRPAVPERAPV